MVQAIKDIFAQFARVKEKGSFAQNMSIVFSGNVLNLILQLVFAPIISRIYGPGAYGEYAYYNLIVSNIGFFAAMSLPSIYVLPKTRFEFLALSKVVVFSMLGLTLLSLLVFFAINDRWFTFEGTYLAIPVVIVLLILNNLNVISGSWNMREKRFRRNTSVSVTSNLFSRSGTLGVGYWWMPSGLGLLAGDLIKGAIVFVTQTTWRLRLVIFRFMFRNNWREVIAAFKRNINVPKYIFPSQLMGKWSTDLYILVIGISYGQEILGLYTFAITLLNIPSRLFENSLRPVLLQKAVEFSRQNNKMVGSLLLRSLKMTFGISILPASLLAVFSPVIFPIIFGDEWAFSGKVVTLISVQYIMLTIIKPYSDFWRVIRREKSSFYVYSLSVLFKVLPLTLIFFNVNFNVFLVASAIGSSIGVLWVLTRLLIYFFHWKYVVFRMAILAFCMALLYTSILLIAFDYLI